MLINCAKVGCKYANEMEAKPKSFVKEHWWNRPQICSLSNLLFSPSYKKLCNEIKCANQNRHQCKVELDNLLDDKWNTYTQRVNDIIQILIHNETIPYKLLNINMSPGLLVYV
jgi:hypothetical protein